MKRTTVIRVITVIAWAAIAVVTIIWARDHHVTLRHLPSTLRMLVRSAGASGPLLILGLYLLRTFIFLPTTLLIVLSGSLYGPVAGVLLNILGENLTANAGFWIGRLLGRSFIAKHEHGWVRTYDKALTDHGFITILLMRVLFFPFDVVNLLSGITGVTYLDYALGTFLGLLPSVVAFSVLGDAFVHPRAFAVFVVLMIITLSIAFFLHRSSSVRKHLKIHA